MKFLFKLLLNLCEKEGDYYVAYIKGVSIIGDVKVYFCEVSKDRPASGIKNGIDIFVAGKLGIWRLTFCDM
ncbi:MAG: hypothetical protein IJS60_08740 [Abditibacteriota bacterium]|nr:hypothetical protein [Abditibacteriota bacterium]